MKGEYKMDYEKAYKQLKEFIINLTPYCDSCANADSESGCDECHRKSINWTIETSIIDEIERKSKQS